MATTRGERIQANCRIIWGEGDYDLDLETDDWETYWAVVKKDYETSFGPPLIITEICPSDEHAWRELDRMLGVWARQIQSGQPMTAEKSLEIHGGPNWRNAGTLKSFIAEYDRREANGTLSRVNTEGPAA